MRYDGEKAQKQIYSLYPSDIERISNLAKVNNTSSSAAVRACLPDHNLLSIYESVLQTTPGLSYSGFVAQLTRMWLVSHAPRLKLPQLLAGLRSDKESDRILAGKLLCLSLGNGLQLTENAEDIEHILIPDLAKLIDRAVCGDPTGCDLLEQILTNKLPEKVISETTESETPEPKRSTQKW